MTYSQNKAHFFNEFSGYFVHIFAFSFVIFSYQKVNYLMMLLIIGGIIMQKKKKKHF